jgi:hypothetical protein
MLGTLFSALGNGLTLPFLYVYLHQVRGIDTRCSHRSRMAVS